MNNLVLSASSVGSENYENQDRYFINDSAMGVFDGVGGSQDGAKASSIASAYVAKEINDSPSLRELLLAANVLIGKQAPFCQTTAIVARATEDNLEVAHCGDSRLYRLREQDFMCLTLDHALQSSDKQEAIRSQFAQSMAESMEDMTTRDQAAFSSRNVITSCLGAKMQPEIVEQDFKLIEGDIYILTSDGVHDNLTHKEIGETVVAQRKIAEGLVNAAVLRSQENHFRSKPDDITVTVMEV